jgi:tRNA (adenine58-N1)-methyltransferase non-catalytic subunit
MSEKEEMAAGPSTGPQSSDQFIGIGHTILLKLPSGEIRTLKLEKDSYVNTLYTGSFVSLFLEP